MNLEFEDLGSLYREVFILLKEKSKLDSYLEPYKSQYAARSILESMKSKISKKLDSLNSSLNVSNDIALTNESIELETKMAVLYLNLGIIGLETEELSTGQEHFEKALKFIYGKEITPNCIIIAILCLNKLAILWSERDDSEKAQQYLLQAKEFYKNYKQQNESPVPISPHELFNCDIPVSCWGGWEALEKLHTLTLYYLAQVLAKLGNSDESAILLLSTLHRQLVSGAYKPIEWAVNASNLADYFVKDNKYRLARRVLAAAWTMIENETTAEAEDLGKQLAEAKAQISVKWGLYCNNLLQHSIDTLEHGHEINPTDGEGALLNQMEFCQLEISSVEESVGYKVVKELDEAKGLFTTGLRWLKGATSFYTLDDHASSHAQVCQQISALYRRLSTFDTAPDRKSKMHKRRIDILSPVVEELNPQFYLQDCRQLDYELGETYLAMVGCKYEILGSGNPSLHEISKINSLVHSSIKHFQRFLDSYIPPSGENVKKYPEVNERPVLVAFFHLGRLWSKLIAQSPSEALNYACKSLENYQSLVRYCDEYPSSASTMSLELPVCREMVQLMPYKIERMRSQMN